MRLEIVRGIRDSAQLGVVIVITYKTFNCSSFIFNDQVEEN